MEQVIIKTFYNHSVVFTVLAYFQKEKVIYKSKSGNDTKEFDAVDFIASLCSHIPNKSPVELGPDFDFTHSLKFGCLPSIYTESEPGSYALRNMDKILEHN